MYVGNLKVLGVDRCCDDIDSLWRRTYGFQVKMGAVSRAGLTNAV